MAIDPQLLQSIAPTGTLRVSINLGNPVLAKAGDGKQPTGVSVDIGRELARQLGVGVAFEAVDTAGKSVDLVEREQADVGFFAIDPKRGALIAFTGPYVLIEGTYMVRADSPIQSNAEVDCPEKRVVVGRGSAYDLYLSRELTRATIVRAASSQAVVETFLAEHADVAAGVRQQLEADAKRVGGLRVLDGRFMVIRQAMGIPKSRGAQGAAWLSDFVERLKAEGFIADALRRNGIDGASVAPAGNADAAA